jgi:Ca-activated chloride channel family protein
MFRFANPLWLTILLLFPLLVLIYWTRRRPATMEYSDLRLTHGLPRSVRSRLLWVPDVLRLIALVLLILAIARPQTGRGLEIIHGEGVDIIIALDISGSMGALDFEPQNRLGAAKQVIGEFIKKRRYDRVGLVVFAREAFSQSPPTFDYAVLSRLLTEIDLAPELGLDDGTAIGLGLAQAATMLRGRDAASRIIILLTDGVNNAGQVDPVTAARAAAALGIKIYSVGVARPGQVLIPVDDPLLGRTVRLVESEIDEETLQQIANETGGLYFRAQDTAGLQQIYEEIDRLEKSDVEVQVLTRYSELAAWLLLPALGFVVLEMILRQTIFRALP